MSESVDCRGSPSRRLRSSGNTTPSTRRSASEAACAYPAPSAAAESPSRIPVVSACGVGSADRAARGSPPAPDTGCPRKLSVPDHGHGTREEDIWLPCGANPFVARGRGASVPSLRARAMKGQRLGLIERAGLIPNPLGSSQLRPKPVGPRHRPGSPRTAPGRAARDSRAAQVCGQRP